MAGAQALRAEGEGGGEHGVPDRGADGVVGEDAGRGGEGGERLAVGVEGCEDVV